MKNKIMQKKIFIKDSTFGHCIFSNNPLPPVQFTDKIIWDRSNAYTNEDIVVYTDNSPEHNEIIPQNIPIQIEYEDDDILIIVPLLLALVCCISF